MLGGLKITEKFMEIENYTSESDMASETGKSNYGGWLRFFRIINFLSAVIYATVIILACGMYSYVGWESDQEMIDSGFYLIEMAPGLLFSILIWKSVLLVSEDTPSKIENYMRYDLGLSILIWALLYFMNKQGFYSDDPIPAFGSFIYYLIWSRYFSRSKRVLAFYGNNAV